MELLDLSLHPLHHQQQKQQIIAGDLRESIIKKHNDYGDDDDHGPSWADMLPDVLAKIFSWLSVEDLLGSIPQVCRSWRHVSQDAVCWQKVDLDGWSRGRKPEAIERMLILLVNRSRGCLREINAPNLSNDNMLRIIAWSGSPIQVLRIRNSLLTEDCMSQLAPNFTLVTVLDISGCALSKASLESIGKHCKLLTQLNLNMYPHGSSISTCDDKAFAVAQYMPRLKHLEIAYGVLTNIGLKALLDRCTKLEYLDLRGCWQLNIEETFVKEARKRLKVFHPPVVEHDIYYTDDSDFDLSDYYDEFDFFAEMWSEEGSDDELEDVEDIWIDMHEEEINGTLYFWPDTSPSP